MKKSIFILLSLSNVILFGQDIHFSQFDMTPVLINPAQAGMYEGNARLHLNNKNQWSSLGNPYQTIHASFDLPMFKKDYRKAHLGLGLDFYSDKAGDAQFGNTVGGLAVSGIVPINGFNRLGVGIFSSFGQYSANLSKLTWGSQFDGETFNEDYNSNEILTFNSKMYFDLSTGIMYEYMNANSQFLTEDIVRFRLGAAMYHINKPIQQFLANDNELPQKLVFHTSLHYDFIDSKVSLLPSAYYSIQLKYREMLVGFLFKYELKQGTKYTGLFNRSALYLGAYYRNNDAIIPQLGFEFTNFMLALSYDYNISSLATNGTNGNGGIEISFRYTAWPKAILKRKS